MDDYKKLLIDLEQRNKPRGRNALESAGGAYASVGAGRASSLGLGEAEDATRQSVNNVDLLHHMHQTGSFAKGMAPGHTASTFFSQRQQEARRAGPEASEYFPQLRSTLQSTQEQRPRNGRMGLPPSTFSSMSQFSDKRAMPARRSIGVISR